MDLDILIDSKESELELLKGGCIEKYNQTLKELEELLAKLKEVQNAWTNENETLKDKARTRKGTSQDKRRKRFIHYEDWETI